MERAILDFVRNRAANRCEYCRLPQEVYDLTFYVEHIIARQHQRNDDPSNLALACDRCNLHKGTNLVTIDPETGEQINLFDPRTDSWDEHFTFLGAEILGLTATGRATVRLLTMNAERRLLLRKRLLSE